MRSGLGSRGQEGRDTPAVRQQLRLRGGQRRQSFLALQRTLPTPQASQERHLRVNFNHLSSFLVNLHSKFVSHKNKLDAQFFTVSEISN